LVTLLSYGVFVGPDVLRSLQLRVSGWWTFCSNLTIFWQFVFLPQRRPEYKGGIHSKSKCSGCQDSFLSKQWVDTENLTLCLHRGRCIFCG
jgi:hypothetical protein